MRWQTGAFVDKFISMHGQPSNILDVGSYDVSGNIRSHFQGKYTGIDMRLGPNVDVVVNAHDMKTYFQDTTFDCICCFDTFEHDDAFWITLQNMKDLLTPQGYLLLGAPGSNCPEHDHPHDYWRFMPQSMEKMLEGLVDVYIDCQKDDPQHSSPDEIYGWGRKP